ncbi:MAG: response regulator transcription factor [bacterium]|nr:response regulator transcription factor [bacterium]
MDSRPQPLTGAGVAQHVLIVDNDRDAARAARAALEQTGFMVSVVKSVAGAMAWLEKNGLPHLAVVDIALPGEAGLEMCRQIQELADLPVIVATALGEPGTVVDTLREVAEDYIVKPFHPPELAARVERVLRRMGNYAYSMAPITRIDGRMEIDFVHQKAIIDGRPVVLTRTETKLLHVVMRRARRPVTIDYLLRRIWPFDEVFEDRLRVHVHRLRHKIEPDPAAPSYLITQRGVGYSFLPAA